MYKDKGKQREAVKLATRRYRAKGITKVSRKQGITSKSITVSQELTPTEKHTARLFRAILHNTPKPQSHNPMMIGYVPPTGE